MIQKTDKSEFEGYLKDASNFTGNADALYIPESFDDLKQIVNYCNSNNLKVTISASRTGLTGGAVPLSGICITTEKLNKILRIDSKNMILEVEPGVTWKAVEEYLDRFDLFYPPNPTEKNSSIGGNVSNNASGSRTFKYGTTRDWVAYLKILTIEGEELIIRDTDIVQNDNYEVISHKGHKYSFSIEESRTKIKKNTSGYFVHKNMSLTDLFIGSEGTLGIVTEIGLRVRNKPKNILGLVSFFSDYNFCMSYIEKVRMYSNDNENLLSSRVIEFFDFNSLELLRPNYPNLPENAVAAVWTEQESNEQINNDIIENWYNLILDYSELADDTWIAINDNEHERQSEFRHCLPLSVNEKLSLNNQIKLATDSAVPENSFNDYFKYMIELTNESGMDHAIYGHIGDFHLHCNIFYNVDEKVLAENLYVDLLKTAVKMGGTISAEHGIGKIKRRYMNIMYNEYELEYFRNIKKVFDPKYLLGEGNIF